MTPQAAEARHKHCKGRRQPLTAAGGRSGSAFAPRTEAAARGRAGFVSGRRRFFVA